MNIKSRYMSFLDSSHTDYPRQMRWKQRGICPGSAGEQDTDPSCQNWTEREQPGTPQQNNFVHTYATSLACGVYMVLSTIYAVRDWKIDFDEQAHINNVRNWMAAACEIVSLNQCGCGKSYEQWGRRPAPPCATCEKPGIRRERHRTGWKRRQVSTTSQWPASPALSKL